MMRKIKENYAQLLAAVMNATRHIGFKKEKPKFSADYTSQCENVMHGFPTAIYAVDVNGKIVWYNKAAVLLWGREPDLSKDFWCGSWKIYHRDGTQLKLAECTMAEVIKHGRAINNDEIVVEREDGSKRHVTSHVTPVFDDDGKIFGAVNMLIDHTEQKKAEKALQESERFNQGVFASLSSHIAVIDEYGTIISVNNAWDTFAKANGQTGLGRSSKGSNYFEVCKQAADAGDQWAKQALAGILSVLHKEKKIFEMEYPCNSPGQERWFTLQAMTFECDIPAVVLVHQDITKRKTAETDLLLLSDRLQLASQAVNIGIWDWDLTDDKLVWDKAMFGIFGIREADFAPRFQSWSETVHPDDIGPITEELQTVLRGERELDSEFRIFWPDGSTHYIKAQGIVQRDASGQPFRMVGINRDITERKIEELERIKIVEDLVQRNKDLEQFSYIVSHNLRAPVANIIGLSDLMQVEQHDIHEGRSIIADLSSSVRKLDGVIKDLNHVLQVKHYAQGNKEIVKFSGMVADIRIGIDHLLKSEEAEIITDFKGADELFTLKSYLHSIFFNLITNSIKYRQSLQKPVIHISSVKENGKTVLIFKDNGLGIDLSKRGGEVFGLYKRFHNQIEGKGMGLYMVKSQTEAIGGKITIESEVNKGTTFKITFENN